MIEDIDRRLAALPFKPFTIVTSGGNYYRVPTARHASLSPNRGRVVVWFDDESSVTVTGLHVVALEDGVPDALTTAESLAPWEEGGLGPK